MHLWAAHQSYCSQYLSERGFVLVKCDVPDRVVLQEQEDELPRGIASMRIVNQKFPTNNAFLGLTVAVLLLTSIPVLQAQDRPNVAQVADLEEAYRKAAIGNDIDFFNKTI